MPHRSLTTRNLELRGLTPSAEPWAAELQAAGHAPEKLVTPASGQRALTCWIDQSM